MSWITNEVIGAVAVLLFAIVLGISVFLGNWQLRDRTNKKSDSG